MSTQQTDTQPTYFDYAAATPVSSEVIDAMQPYLKDNFYNPSATYMVARNIKKMISESRTQIAMILGCKPTEIVFTAGVTESVNLAIQGVMKNYPERSILVGATEHAAVLGAAERYKHQVVPVNTNGVLNLDDLKKKLTDDVVLVSFMYANNETGAIHPIREISAITAQEKKNRLKTGNETPLLLHCDAAQASNYLDLHVSRLGVDLMSVNGAKIYGPKQSGFLFVKNGTELEPLIIGGGQERGYRGGTENVPVIIGFSKALQIAQDIKKDESERLLKLKKYFEKNIAEINGDIELNGDIENSLPNIVSATIPGIDGERFVQELDELGFQLATGAACKADNDGPSHVLLAMGLTDEQAKNSLRISMGRPTTKSDIDRLIEAIATLLKRG